MFTLRQNQPMNTCAITVAQSNAFVTTFDLPPADSGPLDGLRFAVKDTIDVAGFKTGCGNPTWRDSHPAAVVHAVCMEELLLAGARCVGKTISDELAFSLLGENYFYGTPLNAHVPARCREDRRADRLRPLRVDWWILRWEQINGGLIRVPASNCGIWGFRPSHGFVSVAGVSPLAPSFDTVGIPRRALTYWQRWHSFCRPPRRCLRETDDDPFGTQGFRPRRLRHPAKFIAAAAAADAKHSAMLCESHRCKSWLVIKLDIASRAGSIAFA